uniref:Conorfamide-Sr1 n=1 Tax=Conus spurius TaxID=192919 RepID=CRFA1_CONSP|nr:RecName: Full=Conorfamide-Sr1; Short=CNF-Sr1; AltName: Full=Cono-RFamide-Sr1 [Conus spurius]
GPMGWVPVFYRF